MFFFFLFFYQIKNFLFLLWVNLYIIMGIYLHDPPPLNGRFFMTPPFSESQKVVTLPLFPPPSPPANFWQVPYTGFCRFRRFTRFALITFANKNTTRFSDPSQQAYRAPKALRHRSQLPCHGKRKTVHTSNSTVPLWVKYRLQSYSLQGDKVPKTISGEFIFYLGKFVEIFFLFYYFLFLFIA